MRIKAIALTVLLASILVFNTAQVGAIDPNIQTEPPTRVTGLVSYTSEFTPAPGSIGNHRCSIEIEAEAKKESLVSSIGRYWYGEKPPGTKWNGIGIFTDQDWDEGSLTAILSVKTGRVHDASHNIIVLYGKAKVFIGSEHIGNYDFDLVLWPSIDFIGFVLYTIPEIDGETAHGEDQPAWVGSIDDGDIVFS